MISGRYNIQISKFLQEINLISYLLLKRVTASAHTNVYAGQAGKRRCTRLEFIASYKLLFRRQLSWHI